MWPITSDLKANNMRVNHLILLFLFTTVSYCQQLVFRDSPASSTVLFNFPTTLRCTASEPNPPASIVWLKDGVISETDPRGRFTVSYEASTGLSTYSINTVSYQDDGTYQCVALDSEGTILANSNVGQLIVQGFPGFAHPLPSVTVSLGSTAVFECPVLSNPPAEISWTYQDDSPIPSDSDSRFIISPTNVLTIEAVELSDERFYVCHAVNSYGRNSSSARLSIGIPPPELNLMITPSVPDVLQLNQGDSLSLSCSVSSGALFSSITWTRGSTVVADVSQTSETLLLSIPAVQFEDGGLYSCTVMEPSGESQTLSVRVEVDVPPSFTTIPEDITVTENEPFVFTSTCTAVGEPKPVITWLRADGTVIPEENEVPQFGVLTRADAGMFVCMAENSAGQTRAQFTVTVQGVPLFNRPLANLEASFGQDVVFVCEAEGPPEPSNSWNRLDGSGLPNGAVISSDTTRLHLLSVHAEDKGTYQCTATNDFGSAVSTATLSVLERPQILDATNGPIYIEIGTSFSLMCSFSGPPSVAQIWSLNEVLLMPSTDPNLSVSSDGTLTVIAPGEQYSGEYVCNVTTSYSFDFVRIMVFVGRPPQFTQPPFDIDLGPGSMTTLPCVSSGVPTPWSTWFKTDMFGVRNELPIVGPSFTKLSSGLELHDVNREDSGIYECMVDNGVGVTQQSANIRVEGAPLVSRVFPSQLPAGVPSAILTCETTFNFPVGEVTWRREDGVELSPERFTITSSGELQIVNVTLDDEAVYVCSVTNLYGSSSGNSAVSIFTVPVINFESTDVIVRFQTESSVSCPVSGRPTPQIQWLYNGADVNDVAGFDVDSVSGDLLVPNPTPSLEGTLTCVANNSIGMDSADVQLLVRGPPVNSIDALHFGAITTIATVRWSAPISVIFVASYQLETSRPGVAGSRRPVQTISSTLRQFLVGGLSPGTLYEFTVRPLFGGGVVGEDRSTTITTLETAPSGPPQNITLTPRGGAFNVLWTLPLESERNGEIVSYQILYRRVPQNATIDSPFNSTMYVRNGTSDVLHSLTVEGLEELVVYQVKLYASTQVGDGPESELMNVTTARRLNFTPVDFQLVVNLVIGVGAAVLGGLLLTACVLFWCVTLVPCHRRYTKMAKHKPLTNEEEFDKRKNDRQAKAISGPIPGITPKFDSSVDGKFKIQGELGNIKSLQPKVVRQEDVASPPRQGENVKVVPRDEIFVSQGGADDYNDPADAVSPDYDVPNPGRGGRPNKGKVMRPDSGIYSEVVDTRKLVGGTEETDGGQSGRSVKEESATNLEPRVVVQASPERRGPEGEDTGKDTSQLIYATISQEHKQKKREKMERQTSAEESKSMKQEKKMQEKMEREQKKQEEKRNKQEEKERKKREKELAKEKAKRASLGLDNVMHLHEIDTSSKSGRAQAQFIDASTAALF